MDTDTAAELEQLRARAYGPGADIQTDVAAQRRLSELEALARTPERAPDASPADSTIQHAVENPPPQEPVAPPASVTTAVQDRPDEPTVDASTPRDVAPAPRRRLSRTVRLLWAGSIVATAAVTAACTYGLVAMAPVSASSGAPQVATLQPQTPGKKIPPGWGGVGPSSRTWEFYGLTLFETTSGMFGGIGEDCVMLVTTEEIPEEEDAAEDGWSLSAVSASGCSVGAFPTTIELTVNSSAPEELRAAFGGSSLQFVKQGDQIGVFQDKG